MKALDLKNKVCVVVGGAGDIGSGISKTLADAGAKTLIIDRDEPASMRLVKEIGKDPDSSPYFFQCDVTSREEVKKTVAKIIKEFGHIDTIVYSAGYGSLFPFKDLPDAEWEKSMAINLYGAFYFIQESISDMLDRKKGNIILIGSTTTINGSGGGAQYAVSKVALLGLLKSLTYDLLPEGIRVNMVSPGVVDTKMLRLRYPDTPEVNKKINEGIPLGRMAKPEDIANVVLFLACDMSEYICGQEIIADGGRIIYRRPK